MTPTLDDMTLPQRAAAVTGRHDYGEVFWAPLGPENIEFRRNRSASNFTRELRRGMWSYRWAAARIGLDTGAAEACDTRVLADQCSIVPRRAQFPQLTLMSLTLWVMVPSALIVKCTL
jgi:hypothetical protein